MEAVIATPIWEPDIHVHTTYDGTIYMDTTIKARTERVVPSLLVFAPVSGKTVTYNPKLDIQVFGSQNGVGINGENYSYSIYDKQSPTVSLMYKEVTGIIARYFTADTPSGGISSITAQGINMVFDSGNHSYSVEEVNLSSTSIMAAAASSGTYVTIKDSGGSTVLAQGLGAISYMLKLSPGETQTLQISSGAAAAGRPGDRTGVYVNGGPRLMILTVSEEQAYGQAVSDTKGVFDVQSGKKYQFKVVPNRRPILIPGNSSFRCAGIHQVGNAWYAG